MKQIVALVASLVLAMILPAVGQDYVSYSAYLNDTAIIQGDMGWMAGEITNLTTVVNELKARPTVSPAIYASAGISVTNSSGVNLIVERENQQPVSVKDSKDVNGIVGGNESYSLNMNNGNNDVFGVAGVNMNNGDYDGFSANPVTASSFTADTLASSTGYNTTAAELLNEDMVVEGNRMNRWEYNEVMHQQNVPNLPLWDSYVELRSYEATNNVSVLDAPMTLVAT